MSHDLLSVKALNKFISNFQRAFTNVVEPKEAFMLEMKKLNENLDAITMLLRTTIDQIPETSASQKEKLRYHDMVD